MRTDLDVKRLLIAYLVAATAQTIFILVKMEPPHFGMWLPIFAGVLFYWLAPLSGVYVLLTQGIASDWWQGLLVFALFFAPLYLYGRPRTGKAVLIEKEAP